jgi:hypothetical protein
MGQLILASCDIKSVGNNGLLLSGFLANLRQECVKFGH